MSFAAVTEEEYDSGPDLPIFGGGGGGCPNLPPNISHFLSQEFLLSVVMAKISVELEENQKELEDHEPQGGGGTLGREIEHESVSFTTPTACDILSQIMAFKLIYIWDRDCTLNPTSDDVDDEDTPTYDDDDDYAMSDDRPSLGLPLVDDYAMSDDEDTPTYDDDSDIDRPRLGLPLVDDNAMSDDKDDEEDDESDDDSDLDYPCLGIPLVEVFSVVINKKKKNILADREMKPGGISIYGTIALDDGLTTEYIYNTKREDSESITPGGDTTTALLLTGLSRPFAAADTLTIDVSLMDGDGDGDGDGDIVFCRGTVYYHFILGIGRMYEGEKVTSEKYFDPTGSIYDTPLATVIDGSSGSVTINYIMFSEGVGANVEVTLLNHGGHGAADVYGLIQAGSNCGSFTYWSVLFQKNSDESLDVRPGQLIPLSRSVVAVNASSSLNVSVELYHRRSRDLSQDDEIVKGTVDFPVQSSGMSEKNISGRHGDIWVKVTWTHW